MKMLGSSTMITEFKLIVYVSLFLLLPHKASADLALPAPFYGWIVDGEVIISGHTGTTGGAVVIPSTIYGCRVTTITHFAFGYWDNLTSLTIPASVTFIGPSAFSGCASLRSVYFQGNAPSIMSDLFDSNSQATVYYVPGTANWSNPWGGRPIAPWVARMTPPRTQTVVNPADIKLSTTVDTSDGRSVGQVQFLLNGTVMGVGTRDFHDRWVFPDGADLEIKDGEDSETIDYHPAVPPPYMYCMDGIYSSTTNFQGSFMTWGPDANGTVSIAFNISTNDRLDAHITGQTPLGTVTLTGGTRAPGSVPAGAQLASDAPIFGPLDDAPVNVPLYNFFWHAPPTGTHALATRAIFTDGSSNDSDTVTLTVEPEAIVNNGTFETGTLAGWENGSVTNAGARSGSYAAVANNWGPPGFLVQELSSRLQPGIDYTFTAYVNIQSNMNLGPMPMPMYIPHLSVAASAWALDYSAAATNSMDLGWQKLELHRSFTAEELATSVYLAVGGMGLLLIDDVSATGVAPPSPFNYTTNSDDTITITGYTGPGGVVRIPDSIDGRVVACIGPVGGKFVNGPESSVFWSYTNLTGVIIPASVTNIEAYAFEVRIGGNLLTSVYFKGNAPTTVGENVLIGANNAIVYYLAGTTGWGSSFGDRPTALRNPKIQAGDGKFGMTANGFSFNIAGPAGQMVVIEGCTNLIDGVWTPIKTNTLTGGSMDFVDPSSTNLIKHYYRVLMPEI